MSYSVQPLPGQISYRRVPRTSGYPRFNRSFGFGADIVTASRFLPANPFAVPVTSTPPSGAVSMAALSCGPGMMPDPILGLCLPDGSDPTKCPPGMTYKAGTGCVFVPQGTGCPAGTQSDPMGISCWPINVPGAQPTQPTSGGGCPTGYAKDPVLGTTCIPTSWPVPGNVTGQGLPTAPGCLLGQVRDASGACVFPFCPPGQTFDVTTGACTAGASAGGYDIVKQACELLPAALRPSGCQGTPTGTSTGSTGAANLQTLCDLIPAGFPTLPGCPAKKDGTTPTPSDVVPPGTGATTTTTTTGLGFGGALLALAAVGAVGGVIYYAQKKKGRR